jgi:hypothetical protein
MMVVANTYMLNIFKKISIFKLDLGKSLFDQKQEKISIKDGFIVKYLNMTGKQILTYGIIGKLKFYQDFTLPEKEFFIFNDESIYGLNYSHEDSKISPENYLASIVQEINQKEGIKNTQVETSTTNGDPDIKLPIDQYIQEMIKKRKNSL